MGGPSQKGGTLNKGGTLGFQHEIPGGLISGARFLLGWRAHVLRDGPQNGMGERSQGTEKSGLENE